MTNIRQELNSIKFTDDVFVTLLKKDHTIKLVDWIQTSY